MVSFFFKYFQTAETLGIHDPIWWQICAHINFWQMGGEKTTNGKIRFGSVPDKNKPKPYRIGFRGIFKSSTIFGLQGREAKCPAGRRTFPQPRCSTCELLSGRVRMSRRGSTVTDFTVGHVVKMEVVTLTRQPCFVGEVACISFSKDSQGTCFTGVVWGWFVFDLCRFCAPQVF